MTHHHSSDIFYISLFSVFCILVYVIVIGSIIINHISENYSFRHPYHHQMSHYFSSAMKCDNRPLRPHLYNTDRAFAALQKRDSELLTEQNKIYLTSSLTATLPSSGDDPKFVVENDNHHMMGKRREQSERSNNNINKASSFYQQQRRKLSPSPDDPNYATTRKNINSSDYVNSFRQTIKSGGSGIFSQKQEKQQQQQSQDHHYHRPTSSSLFASRIEKSVSIAPTNSVVVEPPRGSSNKAGTPTSTTDGTTTNNNPSKSKSRSPEIDHHHVLFNDNDGNCGSTIIRGASSSSSPEAVVVAGFSPTSKAARECYELFDRIRNFSRDLNERTESAFTSFRKNEEEENARKRHKRNQFKTEIEARTLSVPKAINEESEAILRCVLPHHYHYHPGGKLINRSPNRSNKRMKHNSNNTNHNTNNDEDEETEELTEEEKLKQFLIESSNALNSSAYEDDDEAHQLDSWYQFLNKTGKRANHPRDEHQTETVGKLEELRRNTQDKMFSMIDDYDRKTRETLNYKLMWRRIQQNGQLLLSPEERQERKLKAELSAIAYKRLMRDRKRKEKEKQRQQQQQRSGSSSRKLNN